MAITDEEYDAIRRPYIEAIERLKRKYMKDAEPYVSALAKIESARGPRPMTLDDGRAYKYVGPLPSLDDLRSQLDRLPKP